MLKNARQHKIAKSQAKKFREALSRFSDEKKRAKDVHPLLIKAQQDALKSQLHDLQNEIAEYEALQKGKRKFLELDSFDELPRALIQARISLGLSHKDLADRLGLKEQQIQRYESTDYASANLSRISDVIKALDLKVLKNILLPEVNKTFEHLFSRLGELGINDNFIRNRIIPRNIVSFLETNKFKKNESTLVSKAAAYVGRVFDLKPVSIFGDEPLELKYRFAPLFKAPRRKNEKYFNAYTVYAHYLALLVLESTRIETKRVIPTNPLEVREALISNYGDLTFENILRYVWDLGIPVLPLNDPGAFHGACWRVNRKNIIVLKQKTQFMSRWAFDLLHELYHAGQEPEKDKYDVIEYEETSSERYDSLDEKEASIFAGDVLLGGRAEELAQLCVKETDNKLEWLKSAVQKVATRENVLVDYLANYLAFRLTLQGENWWGTANNLQSIQGNSWGAARDIFLQRIDFSRINKVDQTLIQLALTK